MKVCRGCLTDDKLIVLDKLVVNNFNILTDLNIQWIEQVPWYLCKECLDAVNYFIKFRDKCIATDAALKKSMCLNENLKEEPEEYDGVASVKDEPADSDATICYSPVMYLVVDKDEEKEDEAPKKKRRGRPKKIVPNIEQSSIFNCGLCPKVYDSKEYLIKHLDSHKTDDVCGLCKTPCLSYPHMLAHREQHIPPEQQKGCLFCNKSRLKSQHSLEFHYLNEHKLQEKDSLCCKLCFRKYETPRKLSKHMTVKHCVMNFTCNVCSMKFPQQNLLTKHVMLKHRDEMPYHCDQCGYKTKYVCNFKAHMVRRHTADKKVCRPCGRIFSSIELLDKHKSTCPSSKTFICPICGICAKKNSRHLSVHSDVRKHKCEKCPATFKFKAALLTHIDRHNGVKRHQCPYCPMKFYSGATLVKHRRVHTGEKPYVCKICSKGFTGNHNLKVHMKVHGITNLIVKKNSVEQQHAEKNT